MIPVGTPCFLSTRGRIVCPGCLQHEGRVVTITGHGSTERDHVFAPALYCPFKWHNGWIDEVRECFLIPLTPPGVTKDADKRVPVAA